MNRVLNLRPPRIAIGLFAAAALLSYLSPAGTILYFPYTLLGTILMVSGFVMMLWAWLSFHKENTAVCPTAVSTTLVSGGIYRLSRNPMYLGILKMLLGAAFLIGDPLVFGAPTAFFFIIEEHFIPYEEEKLRNRFGESYEKYYEQTRRWL